MIPTVIFPGVLAGGLLSRRPLVAIAVGAVISVLWGVGIAVSNEGLDGFVGGTAVAAANFAFGAVVGAVFWALGSGIRRLAHGIARRRR